MNTALERIRDLAPTLTGAALKVLIELAATAAATHSKQARGSSRKLAERCKISRSSAQLALDQLQRCGIIASSDASRTAEEPTHTLLIETAVPEVPKPGPISEPPPPTNQATEDITLARYQSHSGPEITPPVAKFSGQSGPVFRPPLIDSSRASSTRAFEVIDFDVTATLDRLQKASKKQYDQATFSKAKDMLWGHQVKHCPRNPQNQPPDDEITAQILAICGGSVERLQGMLWEVTEGKREAGYSYAWYVTVALQRICGLTPAAVKAARERLRKPATSTAELQTQIAKTAAAKGMR